MYNDDFQDEDFDAVEELIARFERLKNKEAKGLLDEEQFERVIEYYFENSNEEQALLACDIGRTYYPFSSNMLLLKAEILTQGQKYGQALKILDELDNYDFTSLDATLLRADILLSQIKHDQAAAWLEMRADAFEGREQVEILLELADVYDECEDFDAVFETLKRIIKIDKRHDETLQKICFWAEFTGRLEESVELHTQLTEEDPFSTLAWFNLGAAYQGLKLYEKAIDAYQFCVAIDENYEFAYRNLADAYMRLKQYDEALEVLQKHLELAKPEDVIFEAMGYCYEKKSNFTTARKFYRKASQLSPQDDKIFYKIGQTYSREAQWEKAVKNYSVALNINNENANYCLAIGNCLMEMGVQNEALICYLNAVRLKPGNKSGWLSLLRGLYQAERYEDAITQIHIAREHCGDKPDFQYHLAANLIALGKSKEGLQQLEAALREGPRKLKVFTDLNPDLLRRASVAELIGRYKKK